MSFVRDIAEAAAAGLAVAVAFIVAFGVIAVFVGVFLI